MKEEKNWLPLRNLNHGPLEPKASVPSMSYTNRVFFTFSGEHYFRLLYSLSSKSRLIEKKISFQNNPGMRFTNVRICCHNHYNKKLAQRRKMSGAW